MTPSTARGRVPRHEVRGALLEAERGRVDVDLQHDEVRRPRVR